MEEGFYFEDYAYIDWEDNLICLSYTFQWSDIIYSLWEGVLDEESSEDMRIHLN
jgi:hypothetical protein